MNALEKSILIYFEIKNNSNHDLEYTVANHEIIVIPKKHKTCIRTMQTVDDRQVYVDKDMKYPNFPINVIEGVQLHHLLNHKAFVLFDNSVPKVASLYENVMESSPITI